MRTIGFIGMGNMAQALAVGMIKGGKIIGEEIFAFAPHQERLHENAKRIGFRACASEEEVIENANLVVLACKPYQIAGVIGVTIKGVAALEENGMRNAFMKAVDATF